MVPKTENLRQTLVVALDDPNDEEGPPYNSSCKSRYPTPIHNKKGGDDRMPKGIDHRTVAKFANFEDAAYVELDQQSATGNQDTKHGGGVERLVLGFPYRNAWDGVAKNCDRDSLPLAVLFLSDWMVPQARITPPLYVRPKCFKGVLPALAAIAKEKSDRIDLGSDCATFRQCR